MHGVRAGMEWLRDAAEREAARDGARDGARDDEREGASDAIEARDGTREGPRDGEYMWPSTVSLSARTSAMVGDVEASEQEQNSIVSVICMTLSERRGPAREYSNAVGLTVHSLC